MKLKFDVTAKEYGILRDILTDMLPPDSRVWVFGSRAKNTVRFNSDIDLALEPAKDKPLPKGTLARLKDAFNDAPLPYRVDVLDINDVSKEFQTIIRQQAIAFPLAKSDKVPALRFPEFSEDWLEERFEKSTLSIKSGRSDYQESGEFPVYGSTGQIGFSIKYAFEQPAILVARVGANAGRINRAKGKYGVTDNTLAILLNEHTDFDFAVSLLEKINLNRFVFGSGQPLITGTMLKRIKCTMPTLPEQQKIATFLSAIDTKITQLTKKKTLLEQYKRGVMQKLFSQELRFKDAQGKAFPDWVEKRLGDVASINKGQQLNRDDMIQEACFPVINGGVTASGFTDKTNTEGGIVTVSEGGNSCGHVAWQQSDFWLGGHCYALSPNPIIILDRFLLQILKSLQKKIMRLRVGSGLPNIQKGALSKLEIDLPHPKEQQKIANFLSSIDQKIDLVTTELDHAKTFKKGLLQQMFI